MSQNPRAVEEPRSVEVMAVSKGIVVMILSGVLVLDSLGVLWVTAGIRTSTRTFGMYFCCDQYERKLKFI